MIGIWHLYNGGSVVIDTVLIVTPIVDFSNCSMFCCALLYVHFSFEITLMGKRELASMLSLSTWCLVIVVWLYFVSVVFPDHTHLLLLILH